MDERQFSYLQEMGIPLWVSRDVAEEDISQKQQQAQSEVPTSPVSEQTQQVAMANESVVQPEIITPHLKPEPDLSSKDEPAAETPLDWNALQSVVSQCQRCEELASQRTQTVFGVGNPQADWLIIGEAPGAEEDRRGEPFVGRAGQLLDAMLQSIGLKRPQVYIANVLKCHTPNNRDPKVNEIEACNIYLMRQIELIQPKVILVVGKVAAQTLLKSSEAVGKLRGKVHQLRLDNASESTLPLIVTYHPAYLLRVPAEKAKSWSDLKLAQNVFNR